MKLIHYMAKRKPFEAIVKIGYSNQCTRSEAWNKVKELLLPNCPWEAREPTPEDGPDALWIDMRN